MSNSTYSSPPTIHSYSTEDANKIREAGLNKEISLMIPGRCNLKCKYCYAQHEQIGNAPQDKSTKDYTLDEIKNVIKDAKTLELEEIQIVGAGEPLLCDFFWPLIEYLRKNADIITVFTNGTLITREIAKKLFDMEINTVAKLNSLNPVTQDYISGISGSYHHMKQGIETLRNVGYSTMRYPKMGIHSVICRQNISELPKMWKSFRLKGIIPYFQVLVPPPNANYRYYRAFMVSPSEIKALFNTLREIDRAQFGYDWIPTPPIPAQGCQKSKYGVGIRENLDVSFCAFSNIIIGNLRDISFGDIMKLDVVKKIRYTREFSKGSCGKCDHPTCQGGCRAIAQNLSKDGDVLADDILCWNNDKRMAAF